MAACGYCNSKVIEDIVTRYQTTIYKLDKTSCLEQMHELAITEDIYWDDCGEPFETWLLMANGCFVRYDHYDKTLAITSTSKYFNYCPVCGRKL